MQLVVGKFVEAKHLKNEKTPLSAFSDVGGIFARTIHIPA